MASSFLLGLECKSLNAFKNALKKLAGEGIFVPFPSHGWSSCKWVSGNYIAGFKDGEMIATM